MAYCRYQSEFIKVVIVDTGVNVIHPDLRTAFPENRIRPCTALLTLSNPFHDPYSHGPLIARIVTRNEPNPVLFIVGLVGNEWTYSPSDSYVTMSKVIFTT